MGPGGPGGKSGKMGGALSLLEQSLTLEKLKDENEILEKLKAIGGPTNPQEWYAEKIDP